MVRASASDPGDLGSLPWPEGNAGTDVAALRGFIKEAWAADGLAAAVELASPSLAATVAAILDGTPDPAKAARAAMAIARYVVRMRGRATPFGLFAGAAAARVGGPASVGWHLGHQPAARADGQWLAALVTGLEACAPLRQRLRVAANDLITIRGDRLVVTWLPHASPAARRARVEVSLRRTPPAEAALRLAQSPVDVATLAAMLAAELAPVAAPRIDALIGELMACGALVSNLRPPSTATDGLAHVLNILAEAGADDLPGTAVPTTALRDAHAGLRRSSAAGLGGCAGQMRALAEAPAHPVAADLRLACQVTVPGRVADEAAAAADALARLSPHPRGTPGWREYHARFLERYGLGAVVPATDLADPAAGLGLPGHYATLPADVPAPAGPGRDGRLAALAQQAALDGVVEVVLDDAGIARLAGSEAGSVRPVPHADLVVEVRAASIQAIDCGEFTIVVRGAGRTALATSGRFLHLLPGDQLSEVARFCRALPTGTSGAITAQLSFPPHRPQAENVTRVPLMLPCLLSVAEHHEQGPGQITFGDLAVTADLDRFYLLSLSRRAVIEPMLACGPAWHAVPPIARLLFELPRADRAAVGLFNWGGAADLPFLPRLRLGRTVLSPARWRLRAGDLPSPDADWQEWTTAVSGLRLRLGLPDWVSVGSGDRQLRLDLNQAMDLAVLRAHLGSQPDSAVVTESWAPEDHAWCGGRAHEIVVSLAATTPPVPSPKLLARRGPLPVADREHGHLPGSEMLSARLYGDPALFDLIVARHLPDLADGWPELSHWWFLRYRDPRHHLRLRLHVRDYGQAASRTGRWAAALRRQGLAGDLLLDTYRPETGRFGGGTAMSAAEMLFAADSAAAVAQLGCTETGDGQALTAASLADLAGALLGGRHEGLRWLADHPRPGGGKEPPGRAERLLALAMTAGPRTGETVPAAVRRGWQARADAAARYAGRLGEHGRDAADVVESLLHLHHNRARGTDLAGEAAAYRLARAAALGHTAPRRAATAGPR
jgi:lantibiotic biosynthesis protein